MYQQYIDEPGLKVNGNIIAINPDLWITQAQLSKKLGVRRNVINNRIARYEKNGTLRTYYIEHLGIKLNT